MRSRAQVSGSFAYIFAFLVGAIILVFLLGFAYKYLGFAESLSAAELVRSLSDEFAAFSGSDSAEKTLSFSRDVSFRVFEGQLFSGGQAQDISSPVYAPLDLEGDAIVLATQAVELPYYAGNVFYLSDQRTLSVFVYDDASQEAVEQLQGSAHVFPSAFPQQAISLSQLSSDVDAFSPFTSGYDSVRFLFFSSVPEALTQEIAERFPSAEIVEVQSSLGDYSSGDILFPDGSSVLYLGYPLLVGGLVSADASSYQYSTDLVFQSLSRVTGVYYSKAKYLSSRFPSCDYVPVKTALNNYYGFIGESASSSSYVDAIGLVEEANKDLGGECPEVF